MHSRLFFVLLAMIVGLSVNGWASSNNALHPELTMVHIKVKKTVEAGGDELYLDVTEYPSKGKASHFRVPEYPLHWPSRYLSKLKQVPIWDRAINENESVTLILSLVEQDTPPWNTDDMVGSIRVKLKNENGELQTSWSMPNRVDAPVTVLSKHGKAEKFELLGDRGNYEVYFLLKPMKETNSKKKS